MTKCVTLVGAVLGELTPASFFPPFFLPMPNDDTGVMT